MILKSVVIKLEKKGMGKGPDYSLAIHGKGYFIYNGSENIEIKEKITEGKILSILDELKKIDFFSLEDSYLITEDADHPYSVISFSMTDEKGNVKSKSIIYPDNGKNLSDKLKNFENKINDIVKSKIIIEHTIGRVETKYKDRKKKGEKSTKRKTSFPKKAVAGVIVIVVVLSAFIGLYKFDVIDFDSLFADISDSSQNDNGSPVNTEDGDNSENISSIKDKGYVTAQELYNDLITEGNSVLYKSFKDGDSLLITDIIDMIKYDSGLDVTMIYFNWTENNETYYLSPAFERDITGLYKIGDEVKLNLTIKHVEVTIFDDDYQFDIFEEQWVSEEYFITNIGSQLGGLKGIPYSCISLS